MTAKSMALLRLLSKRYEGLAKATTPLLFCLFACITWPIMRERHKTKGCIIMLVGKVAKIVVQVAVGAAVGVMVNDFSKKYVSEQLQKFMDSVAKEKYKLHKEKIEKVL